MRKISIIIFVFLVSACTTSNVYYHKEASKWEESQPTTENELLYTLYMIGDAGGDTLNSKPLLNGLHVRLQDADPKKSGVVFLGDNIYPEGLHKKTSEFRLQDEGRINAQLDILKDYEGEILFIPGNHDWDRQGPDGLKRVKRQEEYSQKYLNKGNVFRPSHGCPGPEVLKLSPGLVLIAIDTQWWVHEFERTSGEKDGCDVRTPDELMVLFKDLLKKYRNQNVIVTGHHPLYSNGNHGGHFTAKDHLFPITAKNHNAYIPMPIIGSIYPFYRKFLGHPQDISHPVYQDMKNKLVKAMNEYENVIYVCGHEHNLQYTKKENIHHIVSGSGSKITHLKYDGNIDFGARELGYTRIQYYENGEIWLEFMLNDSETKVERIAYRRLLFTRNVVKNEIPLNRVQHSYKDLYATVIPDSNYAAGSIKRIFFGDLNRDLWTTPLKVPYLDIHMEKGGLTPIKKGGGMQTLSLRMQGGDGRQYTLRGIKKNSTFLTEKSLRGTIAQDVIYDGMAGSHPYASVAIPIVSDAAGVYHANPRLVYVPKDSILGDYLEEFGGMFCLFEERPDGDMSNELIFGNSKHVMNYSQAIEKMHGNYDHIVDKKYTVNARLFDMVIGDWDRHDDQWRWASFKEGKKIVYRPIPRDRDQAFFEFNGIFMSVANRKWLIRKFQPFNEDIRDISGQNFNARYFDRAFLNEANREDWLAQAELLKSNLTDEIIAAAIKELPSEGFAITGEEIIATFKARRDKLPEFAQRYYKRLAKSVDIPGTLKDDFFEIIRHDDGSVEVSIYPRKKGHKKKEKRFYHRVFKIDETKEIRLYGLEGNDEYRIKGKVKKSIIVRIIGGFHNDHIEDKSTVNGIRKMTKIYETDGKNEIKKGSEARLKTMTEEKAYDYDRKEFVNNTLSPSLSVGFNPNDGFYIGPG
ncbi:MAG: metallophosphoesterase, partial [Flavobacteriales bacterium]|nr:metallophosphoesterase [Flavobacteriales bacterium]